MVGLALATIERQGDECSADQDLGSVGSSPTPADYEDESDDSGSGDGGAINTAGAVDGSSGESGSREGKKTHSEFAVAAAAVLGSVATFAAVIAVGMAVRRRLGRGHYRHTQLGDGDGGVGGGFEMRHGAVAARHGGDVSGPEDDFLQAKPSKNGSDSHFYRSGHGNGEDDDNEDEVEIDLPRESGGHAAAAGKGGAAAFGRLLKGPTRAGFALTEDGDGVDASEGRLGDI